MSKPLPEPVFWREDGSLHAKKVVQPSLYELILELLFCYPY